MSRISALLALVGLIFALAPPVHAFDAGDLNQDGVVDQKDMAILYQAWRDFRAGTAVASLPGSEPRADINADGVIDHKDFGLFLDSWMGTYKPSITTTDFLVFNVGDKRYWVDSDGIFQWRDSLLALTGFADGVDEQHLPVLEVDEVHDQWRMTGGHILATGIYLGGQGYTYAEPMQLPDKLVQGVAAMVESDVMQGTTNEGHLSLTLTLLDIDQTVATTAHTYPGCAKVEVVRHGTINSVDGLGPARSQPGLSRNQHGEASVHQGRDDGIWDDTDRLGGQPLPAHGGQPAYRNERLHGGRAEVHQHREVAGGGDGGLPGDAGAAGRG
jgi:hypothetical protein